jgi:hypothetical protein
LIFYNKRHRQKALLAKRENILYVFMRPNLNIVYGILLFSVGTCQNLQFKGLSINFNMIETLKHQNWSKFYLKLQEEPKVFFLCWNFFRSLKIIKMGAEHQKIFIRFQVFLIFSMIYKLNKSRYPKRIVKIAKKAIGNTVHQNITNPKRRSL